MPEQHVGFGKRGTRKELAAKQSVGVCPIRGLVCYATRSAAKKAVKSIVSKGKGNTERWDSPGRDLHEYQCGHCDFWHLGR